MVNDPESALIAREDDWRLMRALHLLPSREEQVLRDRFGLDGEPKISKQIAAEQGCTTSRIWQLEKTALRRLRNMAAVRRLAKEQNLLRDWSPNLCYSPPLPLNALDSSTWGDAAAEYLPPPPRKPRRQPTLRMFDLDDPTTWLDRQALDEQVDRGLHFPPRPYIVMAFTSTDGRVVPSREFFATEEQAIEAIARNAGYPVVFCSFAFCVKDGWRFVTKYGSLPDDYVERTYVYPSIRGWK